jgi:hypothetical protein
MSGCDVKFLVYEITTNFLPLIIYERILKCQRHDFCIFEAILTKSIKKNTSTMKLQLQIVLLVCVVSIFGQDNQALKGKPTTLEETIPYLNQYMDDTIKYTFMVLPEQDAVAKMHFPYGMWIRNDWGLWRDSELKKFFNENEVYHPDAMSAIIFTSYHRFLNNEPIDFKGQIEWRKKAFYQTNS